jgi:hypothetical protein
MSRLEGPGSEERLRGLQARFRAVRGGAERLSMFRAAKPIAREFGLFFAAFLIVGFVVWWFVA